MGIRYRAGVVLALTLVAGRAIGVDETIAGRSLSLRQGRETSRLVLVVHAPVVAPLPGTTEDPTLQGGALDISNPETGEFARLEAPAAGWSMNRLGTVFRYRDATRDARPRLRSLVIRHGRKIKVKASTVGITLDEATQGVLAASLATGTRRYCMLFGGEVRRDEPGKFAARDAPPPAACPAAPASETTTTTSTLAPPGRSSTTSTTTQRGPSSTSTTATQRGPSSTSSTTTQLEPSSTSTTRRPTTSSSRPPTTSSTAPPSTSTTARATTSSSTSSTQRATTTSTSSSTTSTAAPDPMGPKKPKPPRHGDDDRSGSDSGPG